MKEPVHLTLKHHNWNYKGEGNSNLVISLSQEKIIIRLHKTETDRIINKDGCYDEKAKREIDFAKKVLLPLLGEEYFKPPLLGFISPSEIIELNDALRSIRPKRRAKKSLHSGWVSIYPDYTFISSNLPYFCSFDSFTQPESNLGMTFCVEIKPKQGWLYPSDRLKKCTFCLNQYLKVEKCDVLTRSDYCPLDLFSGNKNRMIKALESLLKTPQNNLKIFQDGHIVFSDSSNSSYVEVLKRWLEPESHELGDINRLIYKWSELVFSALTKEIKSDDINELSYLIETILIDENEEQFFPVVNETHLCNWKSESLPRNCVLNRILSFQKLQNRSFKHIFQYYKETIKTNCDDYSYVNSLLKSNFLSPIERYLIAATAKDCSILISFQQVHAMNFVSSNVNLIKDIDKGHYLMNIGVLDLDPKPMSCILKHHNRDLSMLEAYMKDFNNSLVTSS